MALLPFHCCYHEHYDLNLGGHVFPTTKFRRIRDHLVTEGLLSDENLLVPGPAAREDLLRVHSSAWVAALVDGTIGYDEVLKLEIPYSQPMVRGFLHHVSGSIMAAESALAAGRAFNIGGGFHHAFQGHGEGFCALHDVGIAIRALQAKSAIARAMIVDTDVHHGNGTAAIFAHDMSVFTLSIHQLHNYPMEKPPSDLDVHLEDGVGDAEYLKRLGAALTQAFERFQPDLIAYVAGSDPFQFDQLGGLKLTMDGMSRRDGMVCAAARERGIPIFVTLAGGYAKEVEDTVRLHVNTAKALAGLDSHSPRLTS